MRRFLQHCICVIVVSFPLSGSGQAEFVETAPLHPTAARYIVHPVSIKIDGDKKYQDVAAEYSSMHSAALGGVFGVVKKVVDDGVDKGKDAVNKVGESLREGEQNLRDGTEHFSDLWKNPLTIPWDKIDVSKVPWDQIDLAKVDWSKVDPSQVDWSKLDLDKIDLSKVDEQWAQIAQEMDKLYQFDLKKEFENATKDFSIEDMAKSGRELLVKQAIDYGRRWLNSPQGMELRSVIVKNHPFYHQVVIGLNFARNNGLITSQSQCFEYSELITKGVGAYIESEGGGPLEKEGAEMFSRDMGKHACAATMPGHPPGNSPGQQSAIPGGRLTTWKSGAGHLGYANVVSTEREHYWKPAPGWVWVSKQNFRVRWEPGRQHPLNPHCIAADQPNNWFPAKGYMIDPKNPIPPNVIRELITGIGAGLAKGREGELLIGEIIPQSYLNDIPKEVRLLPIYYVNGYDVRKLSIEEIIEEHIKGPEGSLVKIEFFDYNMRHRYTFRVKRISYNP